MKKENDQVRSIKYEVGGQRSKTHTKYMKEEREIMEAEFKRVALYHLRAVDGVHNIALMSVVMSSTHSVIGPDNVMTTLR